MSLSGEDPFLHPLVVPSESGEVDICWPSPEFGDGGSLSGMAPSPAVSLGREDSFLELSL